MTVVLKILFCLAIGVCITNGKRYKVRKNYCIYKCIDGETNLACDIDVSIK